MSFHTITMMVRWAVTADEKTAQDLDELKQIPLEQRKRDPRIEQYVRSMKNAWSRGTKIERLATLGWNEYEVVIMLCDLLETIDQLRKDYAKEVAAQGLPPPLRDQDLEQYERVSTETRKKTRK